MVMRASDELVHSTWGMPQSAMECGPKPSICAPFGGGDCGGCATQKLKKPKKPSNTLTAKPQAPTNSGNKGTNDENKR